MMRLIHRMSPAMIEVLHLSKQFMDLRRGPVTALDDVSFDVHAGEIFGLLGPNGAGKTTCLRMLSTVLRPTGGQALVAGHDVARHPGRVRANIGFMSNNTGIYDPRTKRFRKGGTRKGIADIMASKMVEHGGRKFAVNVAIEVKVGRDKLSEHQIRIKQDIEQAGGYYIVARDWQTFIEQWDAIT